MLQTLLEWVTKPRWNRRKIARFGDRKPMTAREFYEHFYAYSGLSQETVAELREEIGRAVEIPPELLRPDDCFDRELKDDPLMYPDGGLAEVAFSADRRCRKSGLNIDIRSLHTLDDYMRVFGTLEATMKASHYES